MFVLLYFGFLVFRRTSVEERQTDRYLLVSIESHIQPNHVQAAYIVIDTIHAHGAS